MKSIYAYLYLRHKNEKEKEIIKQYASSLIRYVFHMLAIMIGINPEKGTRHIKATQAVSIESAGEVVQSQVSEDIQAEPLDAHSPAADFME